MIHAAIITMLDKYNCQSQQDYINALKEIFQEIALLGLWRAKFYEKAAFYGGSALRILYGLDRFSEDLDFTLTKPSKQFDLTPYNEAITAELNSFGFDVSVQGKQKQHDSNIESAFIKAQTQKQLIIIEAPNTITSHIHNMHTIKIKMEVDTDPPGKFDTEVKNVLLPIPYSIKTVTQPDLFAGKIHALLCRPWQKRVKGRDWYDFYWYISRQIPVNLIHLQERLRQSNAWPKNKKLTKSDLIQLVKIKISNTDFENAKQDIKPFLNDPSAIALWTQEFFTVLLTNLTIP